MTDRELLERAAKAQGWEQGYEFNVIDGEFLVLPELKGAKKGYRKPWNPLADDGDALRLAVKLQLQITPGTYNKDESTAYSAGRAEAHEFVHFQQDMAAATRRAIVRAAAALGGGE